MNTSSRDRAAVRVETPHNCPHCNFHTVYPETLRVHVGVEHPTPDARRPCPVCAFRAIDAGVMRIHVANAHTYIKLHECPLCDYRTNYPSALGRHMLDHAGGSSS